MKRLIGLWNPVAGIAMAILGPVWRVIKAILKWATDDWRHAAIVILGVVAGASLFITEPHLRGQVTAVTAERDAERTAHQKTKDDYRQAQIDAANAEAMRLARVTAEQREITHEVERDYQIQLAALHARADSLRREILRAGASIAGAGGSIAVRGVSPAGSGSADAASNPGLPAGAIAPFARTPADQLERDIIASEQAIQLNALIDWVLRQAAIDPNASAAPAGAGQ